MVLKILSSAFIGLWFFMSAIFVAEPLGKPDDLHLRPIARQLDHPDPSVRESAVRKLGGVACMATVSPHPYLEAVTNRLEDSEISVRRAVLESLCVSPYQHADVVERVAQKLEDPDASIRIAAAQALARNDAGSASKKIVKLLEDSDRQVQMAAVKALSTLRPTEVLLETLKSPKAPIRAAVLLLLSGSGLGSSEEIREQIIAHLRDDDPWVRACAVRLLGDWRVEGHADEIRALLKDPSPQVRGSSLLAIIEMNGKPQDYAKDVVALLHDSGECIYLTSSSEDIHDILDPVQLQQRRRLRDEVGKLAEQVLFRWGVDFDGIEALLRGETVTIQGVEVSGSL